MGNVVPALVAMPFVIGGCGLALGRPDAAAIGGGVVAFGLLVGLLALNRFGLYENACMRSALGARFGRSASGTFVGFATPTYRSALDPHEDVGFLEVGDDALVFIGESHTVRLPKTSIRRIGKRANPHSWVGLGGWLSIEATLEGHPARMLVEPRQADTLLGNKRIAKTLHRELQAWVTRPTDSTTSL